MKITKAVFRLLGLGIGLGAALAMNGCNPGGDGDGATGSTEVIEGTSGQRHSYTEPLDHAARPPGTVMAADETNATHRMTLTFSIEGHTEDEEHDYLFRVLDKPSNLVVSLPASGSHADGGGGGYGLYVVPDPLSVFKDNRVSFKISFDETRDGTKTSLGETVDVPLFENDSGQVGMIKYKTEWKAAKADLPKTDK